VVLHTEMLPAVDRQHCQAGSRTSHCCVPLVMQLAYRPRQRSLRTAPLQLCQLRWEEGHVLSAALQAALQKGVSVALPPPPLAPRCLLALSMLMQRGVMSSCGATFWGSCSLQQNKDGDDAARRFKAPRIPLGFSQSLAQCCMMCDSAMLKHWLRVIRDGT